MQDTLRDFRKRQAGVRRKHERMAKGYVNKLDRNGVIVQKPDSKSGSYATRAILLCAICLMGFKAFLLIGLGTDAYTETLAALNTGSGFERAGAWVMQIDPVTAKFSEILSPYLS